MLVMQYKTGTGVTITDDFTGAGTTGPIQDVLPDDWGLVTSFGANGGSGNMILDHTQDYVWKSGGSNQWRAVYNKTYISEPNTRVTVNCIINTGGAGEIGVFSRTTNPTGNPTGTDSSGGYLYYGPNSGILRMGYLGPEYWRFTELDNASVSITPGVPFKMTFDCQANGFFGYINDVLYTSATYGLAGQPGYAGLLGYHQWSGGNYHYIDFEASDS